MWLQLLDYGLPVWLSLWIATPLFALPLTCHAQTFHTLHSFIGPKDGTHPSAALIQAMDGNFYGTTSSGGVYNKGTVFQLTTGGKLTTLHSFTGRDGDYPVAGLVQAIDGKLYGTTTSGGAFGLGTIFSLDILDFASQGIVQKSDTAVHKSNGKEHQSKGP